MNMNKKVAFLPVFLFSFFLLLTACTGSKEKNSVKLYGWSGWNERQVSEDSLRTLFQEWKDHGLVGVCINCGFDLDKTRRAAAIAHEVGLEYHAWAPSMLQGGQDSLWYTVNRLGQSAYTKEHRAYVEYYQTLDPHNPEVVQFMVDKYSQLADIPNVDYVQFDYIRYADVILSEGLWQKYDSIIHHQWRDEQGRVHEYPGADYCYCDACVADFKEQSGIDIREQLAAGVDPSTIEAWAQFRCDNVTRLVNEVCRVLHEKGKKVSADVFPGPDSHARHMVRQQWNKWDVDVFFPMNYNDFYLQPAAWVGEVTAEEVQSTDKPVMSGLFICHDWQHKADIADPEGSGLLPSEIAEAVKGAIAAKAAGICLFTPNSMTPEHWAALEEALAE